MGAASLQAVELITSDGAWTTSAINATSNGGAQTNTSVGGAFSGWGGPAFVNVNNEGDYINMQATASNPQQTYAAGYTYSYNSTAYAALDGHKNNQVAYLTADGSTVAASRISGLNYTGSAGAASTNSRTISGSYVVSAGNPIIGQTIGLRLTSEGIQSRFRADGTSDLSALLTEHADLNGDGVIYSTSFATNANGLIATDHVLDMTLSGVTPNGEFFFMNYTAAGDKNVATFASESDTFREDAIYRISFDAMKKYNSDPTQMDLSFSLGTFTTDMTVTTDLASYSFNVDAEAVGIDGEALSIVITPTGKPDTGTDQFRLYDFEIAARLRRGTVVSIR